MWDWSIVATFRWGTGVGVAAVILVRAWLNVALVWVWHCRRREVGMAAVYIRHWCGHGQEWHWCTRGLVWHWPRHGCQRRHEWWAPAVCGRLPQVKTSAAESIPPKSDGTNAHESSEPSVFPLGNKLDTGSNFRSDGLYSGQGRRRRIVGKPLIPVGGAGRPWKTASRRGVSGTPIMFLGNNWHLHHAVTPSFPRLDFFLFGTSKNRENFPKKKEILY